MFGFIGGMSGGGVGSERGRRSGQVSRRTSKMHRWKSQNLFIDCNFNYNQQVNSASVNKESESLLVHNGFVNNLLFL